MSAIGGLSFGLVLKWVSIGEAQLPYVLILFCPAGLGHHPGCFSAGTEVGLVVLAPKQRCQTGVSVFARAEC